MAMFRTTCAALISLVLATRPAFASSKEVPPPAPAPVERQVPFDSTGSVLELDAERARSLGLADEPFDVARLFQTGETFLLELEVSRAGRLERFRRPITKEQLTSVRTKLTAEFSAREPRQEARLALLGTTTVLGFTLYGGVAANAAVRRHWTLPLFLATGATSVAIPWLLTRNTEVTWGETGMAFYGATRGMGYGLLGSMVVEHSSSNREVPMAAAASAAALTGGFLWARFDELDSGDAHLIGVGGDAGMFFGIAFARLAGTSRSLDAASRLEGLLGLGASGLGLAGGRWLSRFEPHTFGDAEVVRTAGLIGVLGGVAAASQLGRAASDSSPRLVGGLVGSALGLGVGELLIHGRQLTTGEGLLIDLGTVAGAIAGTLSGLAIAQSLNDAAEPLLLTTAALGAAAGFGTSFALLAPAAGLREDAGVPKLSLSLSPTSLLPGSDRSGVPAPLVSLHYVPEW